MDFDSLDYFTSFSYSDLTPSPSTDDSLSPLSEISCHGFAFEESANRFEDLSWGFEDTKIKQAELDVKWTEPHSFLQPNCGVLLQPTCYQPTPVIPPVPQNTCGLGQTSTKARGKRRKLGSNKEVSVSPTPQDIFARDRSLTLNREELLSVTSEEYDRIVERVRNVRELSQEEKREVKKTKSSHQKQGVRPRFTTTQERLCSRIGEETCGVSLGERQIN